MKRRDEERTITLQLANRYLLELLEHTSMDEEHGNIYDRLGLNEYYHGTMQAARQWFIKSYLNHLTSLKWWRYLLPTFLGDTIISIYRKHLNRKYTDTDYHE
jgi:hypothetical protein